MKLQRVLQLNMSGIDVKVLQTKLKEYGFFHEPIDSNFGQNLLVAVTNFQRQAGLKADGNVGTLTWQSLMNWGKSEVVEDEISLSVCYYGFHGLKIYDLPITSDTIIQSENKKTKIVLCNSLGGSRPDWTIKNSNSFNSHYVLGRKSSSIDSKIWDGVIVRAFDDNFASKSSTTSIFIQICNYGTLTLGNDGNFYNAINKIVKSEDVVKLESDFWGSQYFEKYTDLQIQNLRKLLIYMINKWNIQIEGGIYNLDWFSSSENKSEGITNSVDRGIFPQKEMIEMLNSI